MAQEVNRPYAVDQEPGVGSAVRNRDVDEGILQPFRRDVIAPVVGGMGEFGLEILVKGNVEESVQRVLALGLGDVGNAQAFILQVTLVGNLYDLQPRPVGAGVRAIKDILLHANADTVLGELGDALLLGTNQRLHPVGHVVKQVVLGEFELRYGGHRAELSQHRQALGLYLVQPVVALVVTEHDVERPAAHPHHFRQHFSLSSAVVGDADGPAEVADAKLGEYLGEGEEFLAGGHVAGEPATIFGAVLEVLVRGYAESSSRHGIVKNLLHLVKLGIGDGGALAGGDHAQHIAAQGREGDHAAHIDAETLAVEAIHVFREGLPVPAHALAHGFKRNGLDAVHHPHVEVAVLRPGRGEAEAALADGQGGDAELTEREA
ncbi:hypothetical protein GBAR_LOCUS21912 [Geodia barretti]|uniref:Uncharacterized protein n=1 Tax=Geodia barretti TaxID=519541 RepID=A0AA35X6C9_GEOBA|nr:hypothetical protein GBAR_LOCUS21912 [Geodia barretti]